MKEQEKKQQVEFWAKSKDSFEFLVSRCVGFPVQVYWGEFRDDLKYQIMLQAKYETVTSHDNLQQLANDFWQWHIIENPQWFATPIEAAQTFVEAWEQYTENFNSQRQTELNRVQSVHSFLEGDTVIDIRITTTEDGTFAKAHIILRSWSQDNEGTILISPACATYKEIEYWANVRINGLEKVKQEAKRHAP